MLATESEKPTRTMGTVDLEARNIVSVSTANKTHIVNLQQQAARLRDALADAGSFLAAAHRPDPLPALRDLACDWLRAEQVSLDVPAGAEPVCADDSYQVSGPVLIGRRPVGRIVARRRMPFDEDDRAMLAALSQLIGGALEHSSLQSQLDQFASQAKASANTLDQLLSLGRSIVSGAGDPIALALQLAAQIPAMVDGERASVLLVPPEHPGQPVLVLSNGHTSTPERAREVCANGLAGMVMREQAPLIIDETDTDRRWLGLKLSNSDMATRCAMTVPLIWRGVSIGALTVTTTRSRVFNTTHLNLLELVACHTALAFHAAWHEPHHSQPTDTVDAVAAELDAALAAAASGDLNALACARAAAEQLRQLAIRR